MAFANMSERANLPDDFAESELQNRCSNDDVGEAKSQAFSLKAVDSQAAV